MQNGRRPRQIQFSGLDNNATIRAVQLTGESGNALSVLAEVMQRLAVDSGAITGQVAEALDLITAAGDDLSTGSGWTAAGTNAAGDAILSEMQGTISDLHTASESGFNRLYQIIALSSKLSEGIESVQAGFSADRALAEVANRACVTLEQLAGRIPAGLAMSRPARTRIWRNWPRITRWRRSARCTIP